jgi:hypothetical protein
MNQLKGTPSHLYFTVTVKRAGTGIEETFNMVGHVLPETEVPNTQSKENGDVSNTQHGQ